MTFPVGAVTAGRVAVTLQAAAVSQGSPAQIRGDSLAIANLYGAAAAVVVQAAPVIYEAFNLRPNAIAAVIQVVRIVPSRDAAAYVVDRYV